MGKAVTLLIAVLVFCVTATAARADSGCVQGVHATLSWTSTIKGNAVDWPAAARKLGFTVDHSSGACTSSKPCVVAYPPSYGSGIDKTYGHVAVLYSCSGSSCMIGDQNGICGTATTFKKCSSAKTINFSSASVIHPKS
jgi:surface antigen